MRILPRGTSGLKESKLQKFIISLLINFIVVIGVSAQTVYFSGFAFIGDYSQKEYRYPYASRLLEKLSPDADIPLMEAKLAESLDRLRRTDLEIRTGLGDTRDGNSLALAFALTEESVEQARWGTDYLTIYRVIAQILVFDMNEKKVVANFPAMVQHQNISALAASQSDHMSVFEKIYFDSSFGANIFKEWVSRLEAVAIKPSYKNYMKVGSVTVDDSIEPIIPERQGSREVYEAQTAQIFEFFLGSKQGVPLVPYTKGQAIGGKIPARFVNGDAYQLTLPDPDYVVNLLIRPFKHIRKDKNKVEQYAFGAFITVEVKQPDFNKQYLNSKFKNVNVVTFPKSQKIKIDNWFGYQQSLRKLFSDFATQISSRDPKVLKKMTKTKDVKSQLKKFEEILIKCK